MFEKLLLAVTVTFSLNLFVPVRLPSDTTIPASSQVQQHSNIAVSLPNKDPY